jgi:hypothetical protein
MPGRNEKFFSLSSVQSGYGAHSASVGTGVLFTRNKVAGYKTDSLPPGVKARDVWTYTFMPPHAIKVWCLIKHRENLPFHLLVAIRGLQIVS